MENVNVNNAINNKCNNDNSSGIKLVEKPWNRLNEKQRKSVEDRTSHAIRVVAGPGTGKTAVLTARVAFLISELNVNPSNILTLTFTNRAAREMRHRINEIVGNESISSQITMGTFHATCLWILRKDIEGIKFYEDELIDGRNDKAMNGGRAQRKNPYKRGFGVYDEYDSTKAISSIIKTLGWERAEHPPYKYYSKISSLKNEGYYTASEYCKRHPHCEVNILTVFELYEKLLHDRNQIDFDDMLWLTLTLFETNEKFLNFHRKHFPVILVDEFQDTNTTQYKILHKLAENKCNEGDDKYDLDTLNLDDDRIKNRIFVVGDANQSIYTWRGANRENERHFDQDFNPSIYELLKNYRSKQSILDCAHQVILPNYQNSNIEFNASIPVALEGVHEEQNDNNQDMAIHFAQLYDSYAEAEFISNVLLQSNFSSNETIAVLMRTNAQTKSIEREFIRQGIRYDVVNGLRFFDRKEVRDMISFMKCLLNPVQEDLALERVINVPPRRIGAATILRLKNASKTLKMPLWSVIERVALGQHEQKDDSWHPKGPKRLPNLNIRGQQLEGIKSFYRTLVQLQNIVKDEGCSSFVSEGDLLMEEHYNNHRNNNDNGVENDNSTLVELMMTVIHAFGYEDWIRYENISGEDRWANLRELTNLATYYKCNEIDLRKWLDEISLLADPLDTEDSDLLNPKNTNDDDKYTLMQDEVDFNVLINPRDIPRVKLMTIHGAKGLEFDHVFVAGCEEDLLPHFLCGDIEQEIAEERRLLYVAITRAKNKCYLTATQRRHLWGKIKEPKPTRFLDHVFEIEQASGGVKKYIDNLGSFSK